MERKRILFTKKDTAELVIDNIPDINANEVLVKTVYSTVSCGTERANITGDPSVAGAAAAKVEFPRSCGYSSSGVVVETGKDVKNIVAGDRVVVYWGCHSEYNVVPETQVVKFDESIGFDEAAVSFIATFSLAAIRKVRLEAGESVVVMGLGLLGQLAVRLARAAGAVPVIAVDPVEGRREEALAAGADYALDPFESGFAEKVKQLTDGGANAAIEVTGVGAGLDGVLDCMAKFGRVALLGCTRNPDFTIDYYRKIHFPGITIVGAHTMARPNFESHSGYFTHTDDIKAVLKLCAGKRIDIKSMIKKTYTPQECQEVYTQLINDKNFPTVVQFDWRAMGKEEKNSPLQQVR